VSVSFTIVSTAEATEPTPSGHYNVVAVERASLGQSCADDLNRFSGRRRA